MTKIVDYHIDMIRFNVITKLTNGENAEITINSSDLSNETLSAIYKDIDKKLGYKQ
jgi:hypothetical protein